MRKVAKGGRLVDGRGKGGRKRLFSVVLASLLFVSRSAGLRCNIAFVVVSMSTPVLRSREKREENCGKKTTAERKTYRKCRRVSRVQRRRSLDSPVVMRVREASCASRFGIARSFVLRIRIRKSNFEETRNFSLFPFSPLSRSLS